MRKNKNLKKLSDNQIYCIPEENRIHKECKYCRCTMCVNWRDECMTCALCMFEARPFTKCRHFEPFIFASEPYKSYVAELDKNRETRRMYID